MGHKIPMSLKKFYYVKRGFQRKIVEQQRRKSM